jgi:hypothetical protein
MKHLITETDLERFDGYTLTFQHPNLSAADIQYLLGSAYANYYIRPSFGLNFLGLPPMHLDALQPLEAYVRRRHLDTDIAFFSADSAKAHEQ